ncbi:RNA polymerase II-associated protein 1 like protein [Termitomyces sp. J132]|nr:RNA polymerase II-associated protein 1 like protein [Termitomyces sp. J132]
MRYARPEFLDALANETPLPMIVDAECGMPLDLGKFECLWEENGDDSELNPDLHNLPPLDPKDAFLLGDLTQSGSYPNGSSGSGTPLAHVPWLRKTEYISRESSQRSGGQEQKQAQATVIDISRAAQLRDIEASFVACNDNFSLADLRHPNKTGVTAVESYEVLPDADIWSNQYDLFRFSERPGDKSLGEEDPRLDCAILRPMKTEHDSFLAYFLTQDDESALRFKETRFALLPYEVPEEQEETIFTFFRDYETVKVEQEVPNEFLLVLNDGDPPESFDDLTNGVEHKAPRRLKGAYYKNIERKMTLKKKRAATYNEYDDKWEVIRLKHSEMSKEEEDEREEALAEVMDPMFLMVRGDADADGDLEVEDVTVNGGLDFM